MSGAQINLPDTRNRPANTGDSTEFGDSLYQAFKRFNDLVNATGVGVVDFGAWPGSTDATLVVTGQTTVRADSVVDAWVIAKDTADHSADEHWVDAPRVTVGNIIAGVGFTIYARASEPIDVGVESSRTGGTAGSPFDYGQWSVAWAWI